MQLPTGWRQIEQGDELLITPDFIASPSQWNNPTLLWTRSLHIDKNTQCIISCGWPKFFNLNEGVDGFTRTTIDHLRGAVGLGDLWATLKIDGSLLLRYVQNGKVKFRTRGTLGVEMENADEIKLFCKCYPPLMDPAISPDCTLLFEWVSPRNQIVVRYDTPDLVLLGGVRYVPGVKWFEQSPVLFTLSDINEHSDALGINPTLMFPVRLESDLAGLLASMNTELDIEGYVLRYCGFQKMVKIKTQTYLVRHGFKFSLTWPKVVDLWITSGVKTSEEFKSYVETAFDYECWQSVEAAAEKIAFAQREFDRLEARAKDFVASNKHLDRKRFAHKVLERFHPEEQPVVFTTWDGRQVDTKFKIKMFLQYEGCDVPKIDT